MFTDSDVGTLLVIGEASVETAADLASITLGAITESKDPEEAQQQNTVLVTAIMNALRTAGIQPEQIKTAEYRMDPQYEYTDGKETFTGYKVVHLLEIQTEQLDLAGSIIDQAVRNGANTVSNIRFMLARPEAVYSAALALAIQNAFIKAQTLSKAAGTHLDPLPIQITEESSSQPPVLFQKASAFTQDVPIMPGELKVTARISVRYRINASG